MAEPGEFFTAPGAPESDDQEKIWRDVVQRVDEVYSDLLRYEAELEHKNAELEEAQNFISDVIASVSDILAVFDPQGRFLQANPAFLTLIGESEPKISGAALMNFIAPEHRNDARAALRPMARGETRQAEWRFLAQNQPSDLMAVHLAGRFDAEGAYIGAVLTGRPIGKLRRAYEALHQAHLDLQQAQKKLIEQEKMASLGRLVAGVAHELNNPISFVYGNVHVLERYKKAFLGYFDAEHRLPENELLREKFRIDRILADLGPLIEGTLEGAQRVSEIVKNLRRMSFQKAGETQNIDLARLAATAAQWAAQAKGVEAEVAIAVEPGLDLKGDEGQIHQILVNLIDNAFDATRGRPAARIEIRAAKKGEKIEISVADNGDGIGAEALDKIFEPFFTTKPVGEGTGLGLWVSYSLAREHGGTIFAQNGANGGAMFTVSFPA